MSTDFRFASPGWFLLILLLPLVWLWRRRGRAPTVSFSPAYFLFGIRKKLLLSSILPELALFASLLSLIFGLARPQFGDAASQVEKQGIDIMLLLDVSRSMLSEDYQIGAERASRIDVVKQVTDSFVQARPNDRIGIIAFAGRPFVVSPLTLNHDWLLQNLARLEIGLTEDGTAIGSALASAANRLRDPQAKSRVIVLLTDGDNNAGKVPPLTGAEAAAALGIKIYTIGAGTNGLVPFPEVDRYSGQKFYTQQYMPFQEDTCRQIAEIGGGKFYRATDTRAMQSVFHEIDQLEQTKEEVQVEHNYTDVFAWFAGPGTCLLLLSIIFSEAVWRTLP